MEYVFGKVRRSGVDLESVKTVGTEHSNLKGFCTIEKHYPDSIITDNFRVIEKYRSDSNKELCYDWYIIDSHDRNIDKFTPAEGEIKDNIVENAEGLVDIAELSDENSLSIAELAEAIAALDERVTALEGGK